MHVFAGVDEHSVFIIITNSSLESNLYFIRRPNMKNKEEDVQVETFSVTRTRKCEFHVNTVSVCVHNVLSDVQTHEEMEGHHMKVHPSDACNTFNLTCYPSAQ